MRDTVGGDSKPLCKRGGLTEDQKFEKEKKVFDHAMEQVASYWKNVTYCYLKCCSHVVPYDPETSAERADSEAVCESVSGPAYKLEESPRVKKELQFISNHLERRVGTLILTKCNGPCERCSDVSDREIEDVLKQFPSPPPSS